MGGQSGGRKPALGRYEQVARLRAQGLTLTEIGQRLGITRQAVDYLHKRYGTPIPYRVVCRKCRALIAEGEWSLRNNGLVFCPRCLARHADATFADRLKSRRLASGLTQLQLEEASGVTHHAIAAYERGDKEPGWRVAARLVAVLGVELITVPPVGKS
jgi:transcriptional regulator with XRE-family HTH domain